jgi:hypothetical protein
MSTVRRTPEEVRTQGLEALRAALGTVDMIRFIQLYSPGKGDYTAERRAAIERGDLGAPSSGDDEDGSTTASLEPDRELAGARAA